MATPLSARSPCREPVGDGAYFCSHPHHRQIRQLGKTEKCSNIENVAPDPGSCTRVMYATARQGPDFSLYSAVSARTPQTEGTATPRGKLFPAATCPVPLTAARISSS